MRYLTGKNQAVALETRIYRGAGAVSNSIRLCSSVGSTSFDGGTREIDSVTTATADGRIFVMTTMKSDCIEANVIATNKQLDIAVLLPKDENALQWHTVLHFASGKAKIGDKIMCLGSAGATRDGALAHEHHVVTDETLIDLAGGVYKRLPIFFSQGFGAPGTSGSACVNTFGDIVGVRSCGTMDVPVEIDNGLDIYHQNITSGGQIPTGHVQAFLNELVLGSSHNTPAYGPVELIKSADKRCAKRV